MHKDNNTNKGNSDYMFKKKKLFFFRRFKKKTRRIKTKGVRITHENHNRPRAQTHAEETKKGRKNAAGNSLNEKKSQYKRNVACPITFYIFQIKRK